MTEIPVENITFALILPIGPSLESQILHSQSFGSRKYCIRSHTTDWTEPRVGNTAFALILLIGPSLESEILHFHSFCRLDRASSRKYCIRTHSAEWTEPLFGPIHLDWTGNSVRITEVDNVHFQTWHFSVLSLFSGEPPAWGVSQTPLDLSENLFVPAVC